MQDKLFTYRSGTYISRIQLDQTDNLDRRELPQIQNGTKTVGGNGMVGGRFYYFPDHKGFPPKHSSAKRRDAARKNLMGTLQGRQPQMSRSYTYVGSEKTLPLAKVHYDSRVVQENNSPKLLKRSRGSFTLKNGALQSEFENDKPESVYSSSHDINGGTTHSHRSPPQKPHTRRVNLPEIIRELNVGAKRTAAATSPEKYSNLPYDYEFDDTTINDDVSNSFQSNFQSTATASLYLLKHRPITPGLINRLDRLKLPTHTRTEEWVRALPLEKRVQNNENYRIGALNTDRNSRGRKAYPWVYSDK